MHDFVVRDINFILIGVAFNSFSEFRVFIHRFQCESRTNRKKKPKFIKMFPSAYQNWIRDQTHTTHLRFFLLGLCVVFI